MRRPCPPQSFPLDCLRRHSTAMGLDYGHGRQICRLRRLYGICEWKLPACFCGYSSGHRVEAFFTYHIHAGRLFHMPTFMASLELLPTDPRFPSTAVLHAMCAVGSLYSAAVPSSQTYQSTVDAPCKYCQTYLITLANHSAQMNCLRAGGGRGILAPISTDLKRRNCRSPSQSSKRASRNR